MAYCAESDIQQFFGNEQVASWADKDLDGSADAGRVAYAIAEADDYIDNRLRKSRYQVPLQQPDSTDPPTRIVSLSARIAGLVLWEHWGLGSDQDARMKRVREQAENELTMLRSGQMVLSAKEV